MDKFIIPQFIDVEDRIIGPITVRQFGICTVGALMIFVAYKLSDFVLFLVEALVMGGFTIILAFVKVNGKQFQIFLLDILEYVLKVPKFAIWQRNENAPIIKDVKVEKKEEYVFAPKTLSRKKLSEVALIVDTGGVYMGENADQVNVKNDKIE